MNRMDIRRRMLESAASSVSLSYTGDYDYFGDPVKGFAVLKTSGTLTVSGEVDLCLVGGGGRGANATVSVVSGGGGAGGFVSNHLAQVLSDDFAVTIGAGSTVQGSAGGQTKIGTSYTANGGNSATGQSGAVGRGTAGTGASTTGGTGGNGEDGVFPFDDSVNFSSYRVSGCGGGGTGNGTAGTGGLGGGGNGGRMGPGSAGTANTGGGGGGAAASVSTTTGGPGGSGVVFVRWGY